MTLKQINLKSIISWCLYDWANSVFPVIITTFIFANYFILSVAPSKDIGTIEWAHTVTISGIFIGILSPILGAIADHQGNRKPWLAIFTITCIISTGLLWFIYPNPSFVTRAQVLIIIATIALEVGIAFYNAMLEHISPKQYLGRISGWGWGCGYIGGLVGLVIMLIIFIDNHGFGLHLTENQSIRIAGPLVATWFLIFAWPLFIFTKDQPSTSTSVTQSIKKGLHTLKSTIKKIKQYKNIALFLLAHMIYADALNTVFAFGGIVASTLFHMSFNDIILFGIGMNLAAGIGASILAWTDDKKGSKVTIGFSLILMTLSVSGLLLTHKVLWFWIFGMGLSFCIGPIQAASRTLLIRITPSALITEMFGLYNLTGKITSFIGPWVIAIILSHSNNLRIAMSSVIVMLIAGTLILFFVKETP